MNMASTLAFDMAEREYKDAWSAPSSTRFELPPVDVNKVLKERYRVSPEQTLTRAMIWDMETKKAWDPLTYIPVLLTNAPDPRHYEPFEQMVRAGLLRGFIENYIETDLKLKLSRI